MYCVYSIQFQFAKHPLLNTKIEVPPAFWDSKLKCIQDDLPEKYGEAFELNLELKRIFRIAEDVVIFATRMNLPDPVGFVKRTFHPDFDVSSLKDLKNSLEKKDAFKNPDIYFQIDDYILSKVKKVSQHMPRVYKNMKEHLQEFEAFRGKPIKFEILDLTFYEEFVDFLMYDYVHKRRNDKIVGLKINTIGKTIKQFRTFLRNRMRKRIIPPIDMEGWTILEEEVDAVYLPWKQVKLIYQVDLSKQPHLENYRDDFVLGCMTGLRFSDFSRLMKSDLRGDMLYKKQQKSDHWVVIPLRPEAKEILKRRFKNNSFPLTNAEFNRHIKTIAELAGINEPIKHSLYIPTHGNPSFRFMVTPHSEAW